MSKHTIFAIAILCMVGLSSCESDDTDFSSYISGTIPDYELKDINFDQTALTETEAIPSDDNDYHENSTFDRIVTIAFKGGSATVETSASGITSAIDGAHVTITTTKARVHYIVSGTTTNGGLKIYSEKKFKLTLNGTSITNPTGAAINNQCGKSMYVVLADGTTNSLTDGTAYQTPAGEDEKGTLFSEGQIIFSGSGILNVTGNYRNGIVSDDYIVFRPGNVINIACNAKNCVKANDGVSIRGGVLNLDATGPGGKGVNSEASVDVSGGRLTAIASGAVLVEGDDTTGTAALKCDSAFVMTAGEVNLKATSEGGKGLNANGNVVIGGGSLNIEALGGNGLSSAKGLKCDGSADFEGGEAYIYSANSKPVDADGGMTIGATMTATYSNDNKLVTIKTQ